MTTATRHVGFCPICEGDFKLVDATKLVHHGFTRPGVGYIIGDCLAVHRMPYELSDEVCHEYKAMLLNRLASENKFLARLERGEITSFLVERRKPDGGYREMITVEIATPCGYDFMRELDSKIQDTKWSIKGLKREIERMDKWIAAWALKPIRTFDEILETKKAEAAGRKAERDAKRAVKQAKADALKAKYAMWEQEKAQLMAKYRTIFITLGTQLNEADAAVAGIVKHRALEEGYSMQRERSKKGYLSFYARDLEIDDVMVKLGLAEVLDRNGPWVSHKF